VSTRALLTVPARASRGEVIEVRAIVQHPMESGFRVDAMGRTLPRDIVRRVEARLNGALVFAADLHPANAANPYLAFFVRIEEAGELQVSWRGDNGFAHSESARIALA
jgi:sulfur-oxidizing protein SoxZ